MHAYAFVVSLQFWMAIWVVYLMEYRSVSLFTVGLLETFYQGVSVVGIIPAGALADRFGRRRMMFAGVAVEGLGILTLAHAENLPLLLGAYTLWAIGGTVRDPASTAYLYEALAADGRESDFSRVFGLFTAFTGVGFLVGGVAGGALAQISSLQVPVLASALSYVTALGILLLLRDPPRVANLSAPVDRTRYWRTLAAGAGVLKRDLAVRYLVLVTFGLGFAASAHVILMQPFLQHHGVPLAAFGLILIPFRLGAAGASFWAYLIQQRLGFTRAFGLTTFLPIALLLSIALIDHVWLIAAIGVIGMLSMARTPLVADYLNRRTPSETRATVLSLRRFSNSAIMSIGGPLAGVLAERSLSLAFCALAVATAVVVVPSYALWLRADRVSRE